MIQGAVFKDGNGGHRMRSKPAAKGKPETIAGDRPTKTSVYKGKMVRPRWFEHRTFWFVARRVIELSRSERRHQP